MNKSEVHNQTPKRPKDGPTNNQSSIHFFYRIGSPDKRSKAKEQSNYYENDRQATRQDGFSQAHESNFGAN